MPSLCDKCSIMDCPFTIEGPHDMTCFQPMIVYTVTDSKSFEATMDWILSEDD